MRRSDNLDFSAQTLLEDGIVSIYGPINGESAALVTHQLMYLAKKYPNRPIQMLINSPGGEVTAGLAIYDVMNYIPVEVHTIVVGFAASMAAFLLSSGTKGKRCALPNAEILIHQPLGGASGQASDIIIAAKHIERTKNNLNAIMAKNVGKTVEQIAIDTDRDYIMSANEALEYGLIDEIIETKVKAW